MSQITHQNLAVICFSIRHGKKLHNIGSRMDYIMKETGNTYIAAITSHTAYWSNPEVAYFMLTKLHADIEHYNDQRPAEQLPVHHGLS